MRPCKKGQGSMNREIEGKPKTILVVDDDADVLEATQLILEDEGYHVLTTVKSTYLETLRSVGLPDLILLDVFLSGKDGREIVKFLKQQEETRHIPVIMFSAHPSAEETALTSGADDFLAKPFEVDVLLEKVASYM